MIERDYGPQMRDVLDGTLTIAEECSAVVVRHAPDVAMAGLVAAMLLADAVDMEADPLFNGTDPDYEIADELLASLPEVYAHAARVAAMDAAELARIAAAR